MTLEGGCACGAIRYRITKAPMSVHACHCKDCQKLSGTAFAVNLWIERKFFETSGPEPIAWAVPPGNSGKPHEVFACPKCGTGLWNRYDAAPSGVIMLRAGTLDDPSQVTPDIHVFTRSKLPWVELPKNVQAFDTFYRFNETWPPESLARWKALFSGDASAEKS